MLGMIIVALVSASAAAGVTAWLAIRGHHRVVNEMELKHNDAVARYCRETERIRAAWEQMIEQSSVVVDRMIAAVDRAGGPIEATTVPDVRFMYVDRSDIEMPAIDVPPGLLDRPPVMVDEKFGECKKYRFDCWVFVPSPQEANVNQRRAILRAALTAQGARAFSDAVMREIERAVPTEFSDA